MMISFNEYFVKILLFCLMNILIMINMKKKIMPLNYMMILILFTMITLLTNYMYSQMSLYNYMIIISIISGIMIMFLYFTSLMNKNYLKKKINYFYLYTSIISMLIIFLIIYFQKTYSMVLIDQPNSEYNMFHIYLYPTSLVMSSMMWYLLWIMYLSMKSCSMMYFQPLRKIKN